MKNINSDILKIAVLSYYRYTRQMLCVDEAYCNSGISDILVESNKGFYDIEIKINKHDLWKGEERKRKHKNNVKTYLQPNYFIICVLESLKEEAFKWVEETNTKYGILVFSETLFHRRYDNRNEFRDIENCIQSIRKPIKLTDIKSIKLHDILLKRLVSAYITNKQRNNSVAENS